MKIILSIIGIAVLALVGIQFTDIGVGGGMQTITQLNQFRSTSTPYLAITTNTPSKDLYIPYSNATTSTLGIVSITGSTQCLQIATDGNVSGTGAVCGDRSGRRLAL